MQMSRSGQALLDTRCTKPTTSWSTMCIFQKLVKCKYCKNQSQIRNQRSRLRRNTLFLGRKAREFLYQCPLFSDRYIVIEVVRSDGSFYEMNSHRGLFTSTTEAAYSPRTSSKLTSSQSSSKGTKKLPSKSAMAMRREQRIRTPTAFETALKEAILESVLAAHGDWGYGMIKSGFRSKYFFVRE